MNPQMNRKGTATQNGGNVAQKSVVMMWLVNAGNSGNSFALVNARATVGHTNI